MLSLTKLRPKGRHYYKRELGGPEVEKQGPGYWLEAAANGMAAMVGLVGYGTVADVLADSGLGLDQQEAVGHLLTGGERITCLVGPAGAGKSRSLAAAHTAWAAAGYRVVGLAPSAMAASVLADEAGIASDTLAKFLHSATGGWSGLTGRSVVVVDEASMARTADLAALVSHVEAAGAKLVLVGDDHQLGAVGAGGLFATLVGEHGAAELTTVRRFAHAWERAASLRLRAEDRAILPAYRRHGRILGGDRDAMIDAAFAAWSAARAQGRSVVVTAADHDTVDALALRCRAARVAAGEVAEHAVTAGRHVVSVGDEVVTLRNDRRLVTAGDWVRNGQRWVVEGLGRDGSARLSSMDGRGAVRVPRTYVAEHLALGYATTIHKGQGLTVDEGIVVVEASMTAESLYVGMTRGRIANRALVICEGTDPDHGRPFSTAPLEVMGKVMGHVGAEASAHRVMRTELARYDNVSLLRDLVEEHRLHVERQAGPDRAKEIEALVGRADVAAARNRLLADEADAARTIRARELAESLAAEAEGPSLRAHVPGRIGARARWRDHQAGLHADYGLRQAKQAERAALGELAAARHGVPQAERAAEDLARARRAHERRLEWLDANSMEVAWGDALAERLSLSEQQASLARHRGLSRERSARLEPELSRFPVPDLPAAGGTEAVLRRASPGVDPRLGKDPPGRRMGRDGPRLSL